MATNLCDPKLVVVCDPVVVTTLLRLDNLRVDMLQAKGTAPQQAVGLVDGLSDLVLRLTAADIERVKPQLHTLAKKLKSN